MNSLLARLGMPALIGFVLVVPFAVLELVNRGHFEEPFPWVLFGFLWALQAVFAGLMGPVVRTVRAGRPAWVLLGVVVLAMLAFVWASVVLDQLPCFLGVPNCD